ncbi:MAG TPA: hypothetical protein PLK99_02180 [Burkholderiales bacterium]|nr:hypothetical protein [Burkholderiales bacterium]
MKHFLPFALVFTLAACAGAPPLQPVQPIQPCEQAKQPDVVHDIDSLMQYYDKLTILQAEKLVEEKKTVADEYSRTGSDPSRIRLAMLLWLPETPFRDTKTALDLLDKGFTDKGVDSFAKLFKTMIAEQQTAENAQQDLEQMLEKEKKHSAALQNKIDAVKKMEKTFLNHKSKP